VAIGNWDPQGPRKNILLGDYMTDDERNAIDKWFESIRKDVERNLRLHKLCPISPQDFKGVDKYLYRKYCKSNNWDLQKFKLGDGIQFVIYKDIIIP
jgi:hypothetical protein